MAPSRRHHAAPVASAVFVLVSFIVLAPLGSAHEVLGPAMFSDAEPLLAPLIPSPEIQFDGVVGTTEYASLGYWQNVAEGVEVVVEHDNGSLFVGIANGYLGWAAVGFGSPLGETEEIGPLDVVALFLNGTSGQVEERTIPELTDEFTTVPASGAPAVLEFAAAVGSAAIAYEVRIGMNGTGTAGITLEPGSLVPFFVAFGNTTGSPPANLTEGDVHLFQLYPLRPADNPQMIWDLFFGTPAPGPVPTAVAVGVLTLGLSGLAWRTLRRPRRAEK